MSSPSATVKLATDIELLTGSSWTTFQRIEVAELIRKYRFDQVTAAISKARKILEENGASDLSNKIFGE